MICEDIFRSGSEIDSRADQAILICTVDSGGQPHPEKSGVFLYLNCNKQGVTLDTIDPRGLVAGGDIAEEVDPREWSEYIRKSQDTMRVLAEETGGLAVVNQNDFDKALKRIDAETSDYYVLGYYSSNPDPMKRRRRVEVKTTRPDLNVWSRGEYTLRPIPGPEQR